MHMAFREKIAWLTLVTMLVAYGIYFGVIGPAARFGEERMIDIIWSFGLVAAAHAVAMIVGAIVMRSPRRRKRALRPTNATGPSPGVVRRSVIMC